MNTSGKLPWLLAAVVLLETVGNPGCVRRRMTIRTDPPGATVYVDQREIGTSPVSTPFTYYGTRNFVITKDGYETVQASRTFSPPWYQWPVLDFLTENLWPREIRDERIVEFQLVPRATVQPEKLIGRAEQLRQGAATGVVAPLPSAVPPGAASGTPIAPPSS
ncbi:MAG: lipoprotein [Pirellulaceae bacterium]|nr:MAG: lipoprotein [Pirellulaceae bacterium]